MGAQTCQTDSGYPAAELRERVENLSFRDPVAIKAAEISAAGKSIYAYDKGSKVAQAYADFSKEVLADGEKQRLNFNLPSVDDLFSTEEERAEARLEKVVNLSPSEISDFPNHPFKVRMDAAMQEMTESVKQYGVLVPALVRPKPEGGYEMVAGHRRKKAADLAGLAEIPCIVRQLTDDEATIIMVDSNLQREQILPRRRRLLQDEAGRYEKAARRTYRFNLCNGVAQVKSFLCPCRFMAPISSCMQKRVQKAESFLAASYCLPSQSLLLHR